MALTFTPFPDLGNACPEFKLPATDGKTYSLKDFPTGHPLVVMFICNHCPYVQAIEDRLIQLGQDLKKQNVSVVAICSNDAKSHPEDSFENLKKRAEEKSYPFVYLYDESQEVAHKFGAVCTPDFFVYDKNHKLAYRGRLDDSWKDASKVTKRELYEAVQTLIKDQKVSEEQTASMGCSIKWI
ncbi:alkyl hydroperoxide reductase [Bdellovibrio bacteriovorus]|uniref:Alkyl hydroperoxide reductase n=1 Tax=Bdellovibrio bacteriovorus TaxID=959 RepID=A0A161PT56_BDEBC|nr:thioredoxin family protein [Bdellovibrio bacteriovorus]KYG67946.1 alkyl hydroperoxide reductase [Bdellovibrio bacteriovorus]